MSKETQSKFDKLNEKADSGSSKREKRQQQGGGGSGSGSNQDIKGCIDCL